MMSRIWVYLINDLRAIYAEIEQLARWWFDLTRYLQYSLTKDARVRDEAYRQLCSQSRIAQELVKLRNCPPCY
jgi:hypothetical protein